MNNGMNRPGWPGDDVGPRGHGRGRWGRRNDQDFGGGPADNGPFDHAPEEESGGPGHHRRGPRGRGDGFGPGSGAFAPGAGMPPFLRGFGPGPFGPGGGPGGGRRARRGDVRLAALALLAEEPRNGYQIIHALDERTGGAWRPSPGAVYPALSQLEDEGLISPSEVDGQKVFVLTDAGREAASAIGTKPWEAVNEQFAPADIEGAATFWPEFGKLTMAARSLAMTGTPAQVRAATELVQATRRKLFAILADESRPEN